MIETPELHISAQPHPTKPDVEERRLPFISQSILWVNASKIIAIAGTVLISYLGMRLWVFTNRRQQQVFWGKETDT